VPVICGLSFTQTSDATVATAVAFASVLHTRLVLAHALGEMPYLFDLTVRRHLADAARRHLEEVAARVPGEAASSLRIEVLQGGAHRSLLALARQEDAGVLVVGWRGHGGGQQGAPGGVAERCALRASVPVVVAGDPTPFRAWAAGERPLRIAVGVDPAGPFPGTLGWLARLRGAAPCDVVAAHVRFARAGELRHDPALQAMPEGDSAAETKLAGEVAAFVGDLSGAGRLAVAVRLAERHVARELVAAADEHDVDLLVVGTHHSHPARPWSVAAGALHLARMAVATVPAPAPEVQS
jgi:nucleotide-binding universal stress UspA family protein